jgi:hypothetical protein
MEIFSHPENGDMKAFNDSMMEMQKLDISELKKAFYQE